MTAFFGGFCPLPGKLGGDAETGWTAEQHARFAADLLSKKRTGPLCVFSWTAPSAVDTAATLTHYRGMNGVGIAHGPTAGVVTDGLKFTWSNLQFVDPYQVAAPIAIRMAKVSFSSATCVKSTYVLLQNGIEIYAFDAAGDPINPQPAGTCALW